MVASFVSRWPFLTAVALVSAAVSDLLVEAIANTGVFDATYLDCDDSSIAPALLAALILASYVIGLHMQALSRRSRVNRRDWLVDAARAVAARGAFDDFPAIANMQFAALFAMENVEQFAATGQLAGGTSWLGGPLPYSVVIHLTVGAVCTLGARWLLRVSVARFAALVCSALDFVLCALGPRTTAAFVVRRDAASCSHAQAACVRHISGRAPPFSPSPAYII